MPGEWNRVAMITRDEKELPGWIGPALGKEGIVLTCHNCRNEKELLALAGNAEVLWITGANPVLRAETLPKLPGCRAIFRSGSGVDDLPVEAASTRGIPVCNSPESIAEAVAEHAVSLLLALIRRIPADDRAVRSGTWSSSPDGRNWHISHRTLGLVGFGRIARHMIKMLSGFEMKTLCHDPYAPDDLLRGHGVESVSLDELLQRSDYVSLHCPLTQATRHLIGEAQLRRMKPNALLINTARGGVIDQSALCRALADGRIGGAALDVTDPEPPGIDSPLLRLENVIVTPHVAAFSADFAINFWNGAVAALVDICRGDYRSHCVNFDRLTLQA
jgi:D-3-phosphoglycerate dehydrogenase